MQNNTDPALNALENEKKVVVPNHTFSQPNPNPWTSKAKKNTVVIIEVDGKKVSLPIAAFLKREALKLPSMKQNGISVVHFDQMMWHFMHGKTKAESQKAIEDYYTNVVNAYNKAIEEHLKAQESHEEV